MRWRSPRALAATDGPEARRCAARARALIGGLAPLSTSEKRVLAAIQGR